MLLRRDGRQTRSLPPDIGRQKRLDPALLLISQPNEALYLAELHENLPPRDRNALFSEIMCNPSTTSSSPWLTSLGVITQGSSASGRNLIAEPSESWCVPGSRPLPYSAPAGWDCGIVNISDGGPHDASMRCSPPSDSRLVRRDSRRHGGYTAMARRPRSCGLSCTRETKAGSFSANAVPLSDWTRVRVPPFRSASSRAMARP
jgi:hypothetical protein